jgi:outer membrane protein TolC
MKNRVYVLILILFPAYNAVAAQDSLKQLEYDVFLELVKVHHPIAKQANLKVDIANAKVQKSRGAFDPYAYAGLSEKFFDGKSYYKLADGGLKIPTWYGLEFKTGYEQNSGTFLNPEQTVPQGGLWYAGVSASVGKGLFIDQRRAVLQQAKIGVNASIEERRVIYNTLLYEAGSAYWDWFKAYNEVQVYTNGLAFAQQRFEATKNTAVLGERPYIDTLESIIQVQNRQISLQQAQLDYKNATARLGIYLWVDGIIPLELTDETIPPLMDSIATKPLDHTFYLQLDSLSEKHPALRQYRYKIEGLGVERRLKKEQLKPNLNFSYTPLSEPINNNPVSGLSLNNYTWGVEFSMPIFLRKERGDLAITNFKLKESLLDLRNKNAEITYKAVASLNTWTVTHSQANLYQKTVRDYAGLLNGERQKFDAGESSVFLVNRRELGYINAQVKLIALLAKNYKAALGAEYALGLLE